MDSDGNFDISAINLYDFSGSGTAIANGASAVALGVGTFKLVDNRDSHPYLVRRLADGNCWMVENLDLELADYIGKDDSNGGLTRENTDLNTAGKAYWDPAASTLAKAQTFDSTTDLTNYFSIASLNLLGTNQGENQYQSNDVRGDSYHWGSKYYNDETTGVKTLGTDVQNNAYAEIPRSYDSGDFYDSGRNLDGTTYASGVDSTWDANHASTYYGHRYNWYSVTAESGTWNMTHNVAADSICPLGWRLPEASTSGESRGWRKLTYQTYKQPDGTALTSNLMSSKAVRTFPISLVLAGIYNQGGTVGGASGNGHYASSATTAGVSSNTIILYTTTSGTYLAPAASTRKTDGTSVRCVSRGTENQTQPEEPITTCAANSICYDANGGTGSTMANTGSATFGSSKVLSAPTYTRSGYGNGGQTSVKYWDPSASTVKKYTETYASELQSRGLTQDFTGLTTLLLGRTQFYQFLTRYNRENSYVIWGTMVSDDGNFTPISLSVNSNAAIPRSFEDNNWYAYNLWAASAESFIWLTGQSRIPDSLCPAGWRLPTADGTTAMSLMLRDNYGLVTTTSVQNETVSNTMRSLPLSIATEDVTYWYDGSASTGNGTNYWLSNIYNGGSGYRVSFNMNRADNSNFTYSSGTHNAAAGNSIRCLMRQQ